MKKKPDIIYDPRHIVLYEKHCTISIMEARSKLQKEYEDPLNNSFHYYNYELFKNVRVSSD